MRRSRRKKQPQPGGVTGMAVPRGLGHVEIFKSPEDLAAPLKQQAARDIETLRRDLREELEALWDAVDSIASATGHGPVRKIRKV